MFKGRNGALSAVILLLLIVVFLSGWFVMNRRENGARVAGADSEAMLDVSSVNFSDGGRIPVKFSCDGENISPQLTISRTPKSAKSLVITMDDSDASFGGFVHWVVFNAPPALHALPPGASSKPGEMQGALEGQNGFSSIGYGGPCPPAGDSHRYVLRVYALDTLLTLPPGATSRQVTKASEDHVVAEGKLVGLYTRGG